jgi:hypothetical protein
VRDVPAVTVEPEVGALTVVDAPLTIVRAAVLKEVV